MNIYVDFDDCICETARAFSKYAAELFGKNVPYEKIRFFNLKESFSLTDEQYDQMMIKGHEPEMILSYEETPGACDVIKSWIESGYNVYVITGRPFSVYKESRLWLDERGLDGAQLFCLDKYGRDTFLKGSKFNLKLEDYYKMNFDYAVEDSPMAFKFFSHLPNLKVLVYDRPWNQGCDFPSKNFFRCTDWKSIQAAVFDRL